MIELNRPYATSEGPLSLYVHIPFCVRKCHYCDFQSGPVQAAARMRYLEALEKEVRSTPWKGREVRTLFLGGGTPSELTPAELESLCLALHDSFEFSPGCESTIECNPGTLNREFLFGVRNCGFNRLSLGVQSFRDERLRELGRIHNEEEARRAIREIRAAGFGNLNLDLIFAIPGQTLQEWIEDLTEGISFQPEHLSLYNLTIEPGTEFWRRQNSGLLAETDEETAATMFEAAMDQTLARGYLQYEISNYALPTRECLHNLVYWRNQEFLGFGLSAASFMGGRRWVNRRGLAAYCEALEQGRSQVGEVEELAGRAAAGEALFLGLRTDSGASLSELQNRYGFPAQAEFADELRFLDAEGLIENSADRVRLTRRGKLLADSVCAEFLAIPPQH